MMMKHRTAYAMRLAVIGAIALAAVTLATATVAGQRRNGPRDAPRPTTPTPTTPAPAPGVTYARADAELIARRLYEAALGREGDTGGLSGATAEIQRGNLTAVAQQLTTSTEFTSRQASKTPAQLLEQFYKGLLGRTPDTAGVQALLGRVERQQYAGVLVEIVSSPEFRGILASPPSLTPTPRAVATRLDSALACQTRVIEAVSRDAGGRIFLTFDRMPDVSGDGETVQGPGVDRFNDLDRQMTYRCAGTDVTFSYADRRPPAAADARLQFPSAAVRNCQTAVRPGLVFAAAALSATDTNTEYVLGIAGSSTHQCRVNGDRVVLVK